MSGKAPPSDAVPWLAGAILAGGASARMGRAKALLPLADGRTMIEAVADTLRAVTGRIVIASSERLLADCMNVLDLRPACGPLGGIEAVLASGASEAYLIVACDAPRLSRELLEVLRDAPRGPLVTVVRIAGETSPRPLPARFESRALPAVRRALDAGRLAVRDLIAEIDDAVIDVSARWTSALADVDTPDDYARLLAENPQKRGQPPFPGPEKRGQAPSRTLRDDECGV